VEKALPLDVLIALRNWERVAEKKNVGFLAKMGRWRDRKYSGANIIELSRAERGLGR